VATNAERLVERLQNRLELRTQVGGINSPSAASSSASAITSSVVDWKALA
jgi:hypothetical protein